MNKLATIAVLSLLAACTKASRSDECEIADCDQTLIDSCITTVEACEEVGGDAEDTCVDAAIDATDAACAITVPAVR